MSQNGASGERIESLVDYLRHLVDDHGIEETKALWKSERDDFDALHEQAHGERLILRVQRAEVDGGWVGECVSLPGCMSQGATRAECLTNLADAIEAVLTVRETR